MSRHNHNPFDNLLGRYIFPPNLRHDRINKKTFLFVGDTWREVGDIELVFVAVNEGEGYIEVRIPDVEQYALDHADEGVIEWKNWGASVN